jgi:hypothetical protein
MSFRATTYEAAYRAVRALVPALGDDRPLGAEVERVAWDLLMNETLLTVAGRERAQFAVS